MASQIPACPFCGNTTPDLCADDSVFCDDCCTATTLATWQRRTPGPATKAMLTWARTTQESLEIHDSAHTLIQVLQAFRFEWLYPITPPALDRPETSPWKCNVCGEPVRIADDLIPRHIRPDINRAHAAELSNADKKTLANGLGLTD